MCGANKLTAGVRACLYGGGEPLVGEVTRLVMVENYNA